MASKFRNAVSLAIHLRLLPSSTNGLILQSSQQLSSSLECELPPTRLPPAPSVGPTISTHTEARLSTICLPSCYHGPSGRSGLVAWRHSFSTATGAEPPASTEGDEEGEDAEDLYAKIATALEKGVAPERPLLRSLLSCCETPQDVHMALAALHRVRLSNAVKRKQLQNYPEEVAHSLVRACIRAGVPQRALIALENRNTHGLTPSLGSANILLTYAREQGDLSLMQGAMRTMIKSGLKPTARSAETILRTCEERGDLKRLFTLAKEFHANAVALPTEILDTLLDFAASQGRSRDGLLMASLRVERGVPPTLRSTIAVAKLHLLQGNVENAAAAIASFTPAAEQVEEWEAALRSIVQSWPKELPHRKDGTCRAVPEEEMKLRLDAFEAALKARGLSLPAESSTTFEEPTVEDHHRPEDAPTTT